MRLRHAGIVVVFVVFSTLAILSKAGIRSGHRIVNWFKAFRQWWMGIVHFFAARRSARNSNFKAASSLGNPPRVLMILRSDRFQRFHAVGRIDRFADVRRVMEKRRNPRPVSPPHLAHAGVRFPLVF